MSASLVNQNTFNLNSTITDDWGGSHRMVLDLEALASTKDWKLGISMPEGYRVDQIYGAELTQSGNKVYINGEPSNRSLNQGAKTEIVLIIDEGNLSNSDPIKSEFIFADSHNSNSNNNPSVDTAPQTQSNFDIDGNVTQDWNGGYKLELDLKANANAEDWQVDFNLPYEISAAYGVDLVNNGDGNYTINGQNDQVSLAAGQSINPIFIVNDNGQEALVPNSFDVQNTATSEPPANKLTAEPAITDDWQGGYKLEMGITAESNASNWEVDFDLPYTVRAAYGVDLQDNGNGSYTISGQNDQASLYQGQSINPIFIIDDYGQEAVLPQLDSSMTSSFQATEDVVTEPAPKPVAEPAPEPIAEPAPAPIAEPAPEPIVEPAPAPVIESSETVDNQPGSGENVLSVDNDFGGNLKAAIAAASDGDVVQLGSKTYYAGDITLDKDITLDGQEGTVINGGGTSGAVINVNSGATGATIQDLAITNANNGIFGDGANNLTIQNINVNNIGINEVIRGGQNNTGITLSHANGLQLIDSTITDMGRSGVNVGDTEGAIIAGLTVKNVNLAAEHAQSHDAAGIKLFNTNDISIKNNYLSDINAFHIWNDTTTATTIDGNTIEKVGEDFLAPSFNTNVDIAGIYNEKSHNSIVKNNTANALDGFTAFRATEFSTETMTLENNNFSSMELGSTDYWVNEEAEKLIAVTENPDEANFSLFSDEYNAQANIG